MDFAFSHKDFEFDGVTFKRLEVSGFSLVELNYSPDTQVSAHAHEQANFCMAIEGGCTEVYSATRREYRPFTLAFLPPYQLHSIKASSKGMRAFGVDIAPRWLERMREYSVNVEDSVDGPGGVLAQLQTKLFYDFSGWMPLRRWRLKDSHSRCSPRFADITR